MSRTRLSLTRSQVLAFRRRAGALDVRLPPGPDSLRTAAWAGLQDSMPRAALLSIHARVWGTGPDVLDDPSLVQVWGPRFSAFAVAEIDRAVFTLGRLPDDPAGRASAQALADRLETFLDGRRLPYGVAGRGLGLNPNQLRYAAPTGRVVLRWDGARQPEVWTVAAPEADPGAARLELARRFLHVYGPGTLAGFATWAGIRPPGARAAFEGLDRELVPVATPIGEAWLLERDEPAMRAPGPTPASARLLPSGDALYLLQGPDRDLLVPDGRLRDRLWTSRVWPGALLLDGEIAGTWRRSNARLTISPWRGLTAGERAAVEEEAASLPLPGLQGAIDVGWDDPVHQGGIQQP